MIDFATILKAKLPFISVHYDDPVNVLNVLQSIAGKKVMPLPTLKAVPVGDSYLYYTEDLSVVTTEMYRRLCDTGSTAILINPSKPSMLVVDAGVLPTPKLFYTEYLDKIATPEAIPAIVQVLQGLSVKGAQEVLQLTMARCGSILPQEVRKTRQMMTGEHPGLSSLDTDYDFYEWPKQLKEWVELNDPYFLSLTTPEKLVPRGLLLAGEAGTGKSMAAMVIAKHWDVPLFRLDVSLSLNKFLGESEGRIDRNLSIIGNSAPAVLLLDEAEKLFQGNDEGTPLRILSQLLWWLQYHKSKIVTIMTTNNLEALPKELYRAERLDRVIHIEKLPLSASKVFAGKVYQSVLGVPPSPKHLKTLRDLLDHKDKGAFAHADVRVIVYEAIKTNKWVGDAQD